jgi:hypothetical protein
LAANSSPRLCAFFFIMRARSARAGP